MVFKVKRVVEVKILLKKNILRWTKNDTKRKRFKVHILLYFVKKLNENKNNCLTIKDYCYSLKLYNIMWLKYD